MITVDRLLRAAKRAYVAALYKVKPMRHNTLGNLDFTSGLGDSAWLMYGLARSLKPEICVEIGSAQGKSACFVGQALMENGKGKLYAIDPHRQTDWNDGPVYDTYRIITRNLKAGGFDSCVEIVRKTSEDAVIGWDRPIDMLFIDGDHTYEGVKRDWELFSPFVRPFGVVIFHDTAWDFSEYDGRRRDDLGVPRFVEELRQDGYQLITINQDFGVTLVQPVRGGNALTGSAVRSPAALPNSAK